MCLKALYSLRAVDREKSLYFYVTFWATLFCGGWRTVVRGSSLQVFSIVAVHGWLPRHCFERTPSGWHLQAGDFGVSLYLG